jgi:hypothetical protein
MNCIEFPFTSNGFLHECLKREELVCLVKRSKPEHWHFEVVQVIIEPDKTMFGRFIPGHERYPSNEEWGIYAFTYHSTQLKMALERLTKLKKGGSKVKVG